MADKTPLYDFECDQGAVLVQAYGWEIPEHYGEPRREYQAVRSGTGSMDLCYLGKLRVSGRDRSRYLHNMLSNDIKNLKAGTGCYATLLTHQGRMESDLYVYSFPEDYLLECRPVGRERLCGALKKYVVGDIVEIEDRTEDWGVLSLQGPQARPAMEQTVGLALEGQALLEHKTIRRPSGNWVVVHRDRTGCDGYDLWLPAGDLHLVWEKWREKGIQPVGLVALNWLRTEAGIPWYGIDMDEHNLPMEFNLSSAISLTKGCYRGQEIVARVTYRGHLDKGFGGIAVDSMEPPTQGSEIRSGGEKVGEITSSTFSPFLGSPLGLAILKSELLKPGTAVEIICGDRLLAGKVVSLPLVQ